MDGTHSASIRPTGNGTAGSGKYFRMFGEPSAPPLHSDEALHALATRMVLPAATVEDDAEDSAIPAGYTYFAQLVAHDASHQSRTLAQQTLDPEFLTDYRTPRFDLDCIYGRGPEDQPYLYDGDKFSLGAPFLDSRAHDLPRTKKGVALSADFRSDQNAILSQLHGLLLRLHNVLVARGASFLEARRLVCHHYQHVIVTDLLPRLIGSELLSSYLEHRGDRYHLKGLTTYCRAMSDPAIALEFAAAVGRVGHSMVRPSYRLNRGLFLSTIAPDAFDSIVGFKKPMNGSWGIEWNLFVDLHASFDRRLLRDRLQKAYKIDACLAEPLTRLPSVIVNLAERNLVRGRGLRLPSGQAVAAKLGVAPVADEELLIGDESRGDAIPITQVDPSFAGSAPLWVYVQAEAAAARRADRGTSLCPGAHPRQLGEVGGRIMAETFIGLLAADPTSVLNCEFRPTLGRVNEPFDLGDLISAALT
jgi:Animal haem peroxidase